MDKLRAVASRRNNDGFSFVAPKPALSGDAGERIAECVAVEVRGKGNKTQVVLTLETDDGQVGRLWVQVQEPLTSTCRYLHLVRLALGGDPKPGVPIHPKSVFDGKRFRAAVGWRQDKNAPCSENTGPKDAKDFLRFRDLLELLS